MLKFYSSILPLSGLMVLSLSEAAFAGSSVDAKFTSEPTGVNVVVRKRKSQKVVGTCVTPCSLKLKTKRDFSVAFTKPEHSSVITDKSKGVEKDGVLNFHAKLRSMEDVRAEDRLEKAKCEAKNLQPKGGEADRNAQPLLKLSRLKKPKGIIDGGFCKLKFDVNTIGTPENIEVLECSNPLFADPSAAILPKWKYTNSRVEGCPIPKAGVEATVEFN